MDRREALDAAWDLHSEGDENAEVDVGQRRDEGETVERVEPVVKVEKTPVEDAEVLEVTPPKGKGRDDKGKFTAGELTGMAATPKPGTTQQGAAPAVVERPAPVTWRPAAREKWGSIAKDVQDEVLRRDQEVDQALRQTAGARQFANEMSRTIQPFEAMIRAEGGNPVSAVDSLLKTAYNLRTANPQNKAIMVAQMIRQHGVDVKILDEVLSQLVKGQQPNAATDPNIQYIQRELAPIKQFFTEFQQWGTQSQQNVAREAATAVEKFKAENEFAKDVMDDMADIMDMGAKRGIQISLQDAYKRATLAHPEISQIIASRQVTASAAQRSAAARRARNASASLPSGGAPAGAAESGKPVNRRAQIEAAWDQHAEQES